MRVLTKKSEIRKALESCLVGNEAEPKKLANGLLSNILSAKVKFPLLEFCGEEIFARTPKSFHLEICEEVSALKTIGGDVIIGILLRNSLGQNIEEIFQKAAHFIALSGTWHATDIIGERVFGWGLLHHFDQAFSTLEKLKHSDNKWIVRSIGPGCHNAIKNKLSTPKVEKLFVLLLSLANAKEYHIKTGIGWAAKTVAKFHPEIIEKYDLENDHVGQWFRTKVRIGLERNKYAQGN